MKQFFKELGHALRVIGFVFIFLYTIAALIKAIVTQ